METMRVTMLGSGTSTGVPVIGCSCSVCTSTDPKNRRTRVSALIETKGLNLLIDTSTDFRQQALQAGIKRIDAVLYTHHHADHVNGIDELRSLNFMQKAPIPIYANARTMTRIQSFFDHIFSHCIAIGGKAELVTHTIDTAPLTIGDVTVQPIPLTHVDADVTGYRIGPFAYLTDCKAIPESSWPLLDGVTHVILDCLRYDEHQSHMNLQEALAATARLGARRTIFTHIGHDFDHTTVSRELPKGVELGYDGLVLEC